MIKILINVHQLNTEHDNGETYHLSKDFQELNGSHNVVVYKLIYILPQEISFSSMPSLSSFNDSTITEFIVSLFSLFDQ